MPSGTLPTAPGTPATASPARSLRETAREPTQALRAGMTFASRRPGGAVGVLVVVMPSSPRGKRR